MLKWIPFYMFEFISFKSSQTQPHILQPLVWRRQHSLPAWKNQHLNYFYIFSKADLGHSSSHVLYTKQLI